MHIKQTARGDRLTTETETVIEFARGTTKVRTELLGRFVETEDGEPISMWSREQLADDPVERHYTFEKDEVELQTRQGANIETEHLPRPDSPWLTPGEESQFIKARLRAKAEQIEVRTVDPTSGLDVITITRNIKERDVPIEALGKQIKATRWEVVRSDSPQVVQTELVDENGNLVRGSLSMGSYELTMMVSDRQTALRLPDKAPELMVSTFVKPSRPIPRARRAQKVVLNVTVDEGDMPALPSVAAQRATAREEGGFRVTIDMRAEAMEADEAERDDPKYLENSPYVNHEDEKVRELLTRATRRSGTTPAKRAKAMHSFVQRYVRTKDLSKGFASAGEVARDREGDCTEHAVLLTAMLRADGIPARVASGLIYADSFAGHKNLFGYHMWTQALIDGRWVDYDATLRQRFDATHVTLWTSSLSDGSLLTDMSAMLPLLGRLQVEVVDVEY